MRRFGVASLGLPHTSLARRSAGFETVTLGYCARIDQAARVRDMGFDYLEVALAPMCLEDDDAFARANADRAADPTARP